MSSVVGVTTAVARRERAGAVESLLLLLRSARPRQWPKNGVVLLGLVFARYLFDPVPLSRAVLAMVLFCVVSGVVYLVNDLLDAEKDRLHPVKCRRPIASGRLSPALAWTTAAIVGVGGLLASFVLAPAFGAIVASYLVLQAAYVGYFKHAVILDVLVLASGFVLRAIAGVVVIGVPISPWLYVCTMLLALFLALGKRRQELVLLSGDAAGHRPTLDHYTIPLLDQFIQVVTTSLVMAYMLYSFFAESVPRNHSMMFTIPFVFYGLFRYLYLIHVKGEGGAPEEVLLRDRGVALCVLLWGVAVVILLYVLPNA